MSKNCKNLICSIDRDQPEPIELKVFGQIPEWVNGILYRNGGGRYRFNDKVYNHLFDGMACINRFEIRNGRVFFSNRLLQTKVMKHNLEKKSLYPMFGTPDLCSTIFDRFKLMFIDKEIIGHDNANVNVVPFANGLYAISDGYMTLRLNPETLEIINEANLKNYVATASINAHPHIDQDGNWICVGLRPAGYVAAYEFLSFKAKENVNNVFENAKVIARIPSSHSFAASFAHSFAITENYIVFLEQSLIIDYMKVLLNLVRNEPFHTTLRVDKTFQNNIYLINRKTYEILPQKYYTDPQICLHHINAYETIDENSKNTKIVIDLCSYDPDNFSIENFKYDENLDEQIKMFIELPKAFVRRIHVPIVEFQSDKIFCKMENINKKMNIELPAINYAKFNTKAYKYVYGFGMKEEDDSKNPFTIVKINVDRYDDGLEAEIQSINEHMYPSEPVFVENPNGIDEDDGVLLTIVLGDKCDFLLILDAKTLNEISRAELPENILATNTFHGFFANSQNFKF